MNDPIVQRLALAAVVAALGVGLVWLAGPRRAVHAAPGGDSAQLRTAPDMTGLETATFALG